MSALIAIVSSRPVSADGFPVLDSRPRRRKESVFFDGRHHHYSLSDGMRRGRIGVMTDRCDGRPSALTVQRGIATAVNGRMETPIMARNDPARWFAGTIGDALAIRSTCRTAFNSALADASGEFTAVAHFARLPNVLFMACHGSSARLLVSEDGVLAVTEGSGPDPIAEVGAAQLNVENGDTAVISARGATVRDCAGHIKNICGVRHALETAQNAISNVIWKG